MLEAEVGDRLFTPEAFMARFGQPAEPAISARCPHCGSVVMLVRTRWGRAEFSHGWSRAPCDRAVDAETDILRPRGWDFENAERLRAAFLAPEVLERSRGFAGECVGSARYVSADLRRSVEEADRRNIWAWKDLPLWATPYVLLTLVDWRSARLRTTVRFRIERPRCGTIDGLWLEPRDCVLTKTHADTGKRVADRRFPMAVLPLHLLGRSPDRALPWEP